MSFIFICKTALLLIEVTLNQVPNKGCQLDKNTFLASCPWALGLHFPFFYILLYI